MSAMTLLVDDPTIDVVGATSVLELISPVDDVGGMEITVLLNNPASMVRAQS